MPARTIYRGSMDPATAFPVPAGSGCLYRTRAVGSEEDHRSHFLFSSGFDVLWPNKRVHACDSCENQGFAPYFRDFLLLAASPELSVPRYPLGGTGPQSPGAGLDVMKIGISLRRSALARFFPMAACQLLPHVGLDPGDRYLSPHTPWYRLPTPV